MARPRWIEILVSVVPTILAFTPAAGAAPFIIAGVVAAEQIKNATGPEKKVHAIEVARNTAEAAKALGAHVDPNAIAAIADNAIDTVVGIANEISKDDDVIDSDTL